MPALKLTDPAARFAGLFAMQPCWELPELVPCLTDLQVRLFTSLCNTKMEWAFHQNAMLPALEPYPAVPRSTLPLCLKIWNSDTGE